MSNIFGWIEIIKFSTEIPVLGKKIVGKKLTFKIFSALKICKFTCVDNDIAHLRKDSATNYPLVVYVGFFTTEATEVLSHILSDRILLCRRAPPVPVRKRV